MNRYPYLWQVGDIALNNGWQQLASKDFEFKEGVGQCRLLAFNPAVFS